LLPTSLQKENISKENIKLDSHATIGNKTPPVPHQAIMKGQSATRQKKELLSRMTVELDSKYRDRIKIGKALFFNSYYKVILTYIFLLFNE
jgi:hypothetical protein